MGEAIRYLENALKILKSAPVEDGTYTDLKPVRQAFGLAYLAVLESINEYLLEKAGLTKKQLPKSTEAYRGYLKKYFSPYNGKLLREFEKLYDLLHIAGYYRGLLYDKDVVREAFKLARRFIEKIEGLKEAS